MMASRRIVLLQVYLYLVCLVTVIAFVIASAAMIWGGFRMALPRLALREHDYKIISSFEYYKNSRHEARVSEKETPVEPLSQDELRRLWEEEKRLTVDAEQRGGLSQLIQAGIWVVIVVPIYFFHWRAARRLKEPAAEPEGVER
jgi:hypothetical protein